MGSEMNTGANVKGGMTTLRIDQGRGDAAPSKGGENWRMSKGETRPPLAPAEPGLCAALWGRGLDRVSGIAAMYSLKTILFYFAQNFFRGIIMSVEYPSRKKVFQMFYMTKGHLNVSEKTMYECYWGYFYRAWHNEEFSYVHDKGFEEAWELIQRAYWGRNETTY